MKVHKHQMSWCVAVVAALCFAQVKAESAEPKGAKKAAAESVPAQLRIWKEALAEDRALRVQVRPTARKASALDLQTAEGRQFLDYQEVAAGPAVLEVTDAGDSKTKLVTQTLSLGSGSFSTALLREENGRLAVELIDDGAQADAGGELTVRNFAPNLTELRIKVGDEANIRLEGKAALARLRGLPRQLVQVATVGTEATGKQINWANEVDFSRTDRVTLLVYPDAYGRIRPRIVVDGRSRSGAAAPESESGQR